jgi:hypothetical protein
MNQRRSIGLSIITVVGLALSPVSAVAQQNTIEKQLVGTWILVSAESATKDGTKIPFVEGTNIKGLLIFDTGGRESLQIISEIPKLASNDRLKTMPAEDMAVSHGVLSYFGTYSVSESDKVLTQHPERSSFPNQAGLDGKRILAFITPDDLKITLPTTLAGNTNITVWKRAK